MRAVSGGKGERRRRIGCIAGMKVPDIGEVREGSEGREEGLGIQEFEGGGGEGRGGGQLKKRQ